MHCRRRHTSALGDATFIGLGGLATRGARPAKLLEHIMPTATACDQRLQRHRTSPSRPLVLFAELSRFVLPTMFVGYLARMGTMAVSRRHNRPRRSEFDVSPPV